MAETRQQSNRRIRQEELRSQLAEQCRVQHIIDNIEKIEGLGISTEGDTQEIDYKDLQVNQFNLSKLKTANEQRIKLLNKYLPDLKSTEVTGEGGGPIAVRDWTIYTDEELKAIADGDPNAPSP